MVLNKVYELPSPVISVYVVVITILAITRRSKSMYKKEEIKIKNR